jgi:magnesium-transporting ATPase (P-type)
MIREAYEDYQRYKSDSETNKAPVIVLRNNKFESIRSDQVKVGDILLIEDG